MQRWIPFIRGQALKEISESSKRELIERDGEKHYVRRDAETGQFMEWDRVGRSLPADRRQPAKKTIPPGQGDRGDQRRKKGKSGK